ncbi:MAG: DNA-binding protein [Nitrosomonadales bacterium]|jgi:predicted DNA-binding transcriptional regulator AlpA
MKQSANQQATFPPLENETRSHIPTENAAYYLSRAQQTLRVWAMSEPLGMPRPIRINGRLGWPVAQIRALLNGEVA